MILFSIIFIVLISAVAFWQACLLFAAIFGAPTVYANSKAIIDAFELAGLKNGQLVVDLGCGNARSLIIAAKKFGARGVGVDYSPYCYLKSKLNVALAGQNQNIKIIFGDFRAAEQYLRKADVVYLYLLNSGLAKMETWFFEAISPKTNVVVLAFHFAERKPAKTTSTTNLGRKTEVKLYIKN